MNPQTAEQINAQHIGKVEVSASDYFAGTDEMTKEFMKCHVALKLLVEKWLKQSDCDENREDRTFGDRIVANTLRQCAKELEEVISQ